ncbi:MAG: hypothetical protein LAQ69_22745 [Acidobacteriia bacterium]|nr:hypothetical protein [Terriglobia bacterium]
MHVREHKEQAAFRLGAVANHEIDRCAAGVLPVQRDAELVVRGAERERPARGRDALDVQGGAVERELAEIARKRRHAQRGGAQELLRRQVEGQIQLEVLEVEVAAARVGGLFVIRVLGEGGSEKQRGEQCGFHKRMT